MPTSTIHLSVRPIARSVRQIKLTMFLFISILQILTILTGLFCLRQKRPVVLQLLLVIIAFATINEVFIVRNVWEWWRLAPNIFYNYFSFVDMAVWTAIYVNIFKSKLLRRGIAATGILLLLLSCAEIIYFKDLMRLHTITLMCFAILMIILSLLYFFLIYNKEYHHVSRDPHFWVCAASIAFNAIFFFNLQMLSQQQFLEDPDAIRIFDFLQVLGLCAYYLFICTAFIISYYKYRQVSGRASL
jgi:hypothetical protein